MNTDSAITEVPDVPERSRHRTISRSMSLPNLPRGTSPIPTERGLLGRPFDPDFDDNMIGFPSAEILIHQRLELLREDNKYTHRVRDRIDPDDGSLWGDDPGPRGPIVGFRAEKTRDEKLADVDTRIAGRKAKGKTPFSDPIKHLRYNLMNRVQQQMTDSKRAEEAEALAAWSLDQDEREEQWQREIEVESRERELQRQQRRDRIIPQLASEGSLWARLLSFLNPDEYLAVIENYDPDAVAAELKQEPVIVENDDGTKKREDEDEDEDNPSFLLLNESFNDGEDDDIFSLERMEEIQIPADFPFLSRSPSRSVYVLPPSSSIDIDVDVSPQFVPLPPSPTDPAFRPSTALTAGSTTTETTTMPATAPALLSLPPSPIRSVRRRLLSLLGRRSSRSDSESPANDPYQPAAELAGTTTINISVPVDIPCMGSATPAAAAVTTTIQHNYRFEDEIDEDMAAIEAIIADLERWEDD